MKYNLRGINRCLRCSEESDSRRGASSQIENSQPADGYILRTRACTVCGQTWTTAEVRTSDLRRWRKMEKIVEMLQATKKPAQGGPSVSRSKEQIAHHRNGGAEDGANENTQNPID